MKKLLSLITIMSMIFTMGIGVYANGENDSILSCDYDSTFVIKDDGSLWGWGNGYIGNGTSHGSETYLPVKVLENVRSVSSNVRTTVAVKKDDTLWGWGSFSGFILGKQNPRFETPVQLLEDVKSVANGDKYIMVIKNDSSLWVVGDINLGDGTNTMADGKVGFVKIMENVKGCFAGEKTAYVIKKDNTLWGWGDNSDAQLGNMTIEGDNSVSAVLRPVKILDDVKSVYQSGTTCFAIRLDNSLYSWGNDGIYTENGWIDEAGSPYKVMDNVISVTAKDNGSGVLVVKTDNTLWGWNTQWHNEGSPLIPYKYADHVKYVSNGERHAAVLKTDNTLFTMGGNYRHGLGYESNAVWYTPLTKVMDNVQDSPASWAVEYVEKAIGLQLIPEDMQGKYGQTINREEFCILAVRLIEKKSGMSIEAYIKLRGLEMASSDTFTDTNNVDIFAAKTLGITKGTSQTTFSPEQLLTREQAATFLSNTAKAVGKDITAEIPTYADLEDIANWARPFTGYVYNIDVMRGVGNNKFDPKGGYQRQAAYITMYKLFSAIDQVSTDEVVIKSKPLVEEVSSTLDSIQADISKISGPTMFTVTIEGTSVSSEWNRLLKYEGYFRNTDVRLDTYWHGMAVSKAIYNETKDQTYVESLRYTHFAELTKGNMLPFTSLDVKYLEQLEIDKDTEFFTAKYEMFNNEKVLYVKSTIKNGVTTEFWYSLKYKIPVKFHQVFVEEESTNTIEWAVVSINDNAVLTDETFYIPEGLRPTKSADDYYGEDQTTGTTRDLLLYEVSSIVTEEKGLMDMTQILYYSNLDFDELTAYFVHLMKDSSGYSLDQLDNKSIIEGRVNNDTVIVIVNDHKTSENNTVNGVNINYYE